MIQNPDLCKANKMEEVQDQELQNLSFNQSNFWWSSLRTSLMFVLQVPAFMALSVLHFYWCCCSQESLLSRLSRYQSDKNNGCISCLRLDFMHYFIFDLVLQSKIWKEEFSTWATLVTSCWMYSIFEDSWRWPKPNAICWPDTKVWRHHRIWFWIHEVRSKTKICVLEL